jgi:hypothetical protein
MKTACTTSSVNALRESLREVPLEVLFGLRYGTPEAQEEVYRQCFRPVSLAIRRAFGGQRRLDVDAVVASAFRTYFRYPVVSRKDPGELHGDWGTLAGHIIRIANNKAFRDLRTLGRETPMSTIGCDDQERQGAALLEPVATGRSPVDELAQGEHETELEAAARAVRGAKESVKQALRSAAEPELAGLKSAQDRMMFHKQYGAALGLSADPEVTGPAAGERAPSAEALKKRCQRQAQRIKARLLRLMRRPAPGPHNPGVADTPDRAVRAALSDRIAEVVELIVSGLSPQDLVIYCGALDQAPSAEISAGLPADRSLSPELIRRREVPRVLREVDAILKRFSASVPDLLESHNACAAC